MGDPRRLARAASRPWPRPAHRFETRFTLPGRPAFVAVRARDAAGRALSTTARHPRRLASRRRATSPPASSHGAEQRHAAELEARERQAPALLALVAGRAR